MEKKFSEFGRVIRIILFGPGAIFTLLILVIYLYNRPKQQKHFEWFP